MTSIYPQKNENQDSVFALFDDCNATLTHPTSRLYTRYLSQITVSSAIDLIDALDQLSCYIQNGHHVVCLLNYELEPNLKTTCERPNQKSVATFLFYEKCDLLSATQVKEWLFNRSTSSSDNVDIAGIAGLTASIDATQFCKSVEKIKAYIEAGDAYQVNYSFRLHFDTYGSATALYRKLRMRQPVPFGALIALPDGTTILSYSPELFIQHTDGILTARPMKGTAPASSDPQQNSKQAFDLAADAKNRAENLMIVDLLRNDLSRVAELGSVHVSHLFEVEHYQSVLQMTSTIHAKLAAGITLHEILVALFPCGSITGAPKRRAMEIIAELEVDSRNLYTGAIGWFEAPKKDSTVENFCFSVPIRTLVLGQRDNNGTCHGLLGIGAGIVHDSVAMQEFEECMLKAAFLTGLASDFELFETMVANRIQGCRYMTLHLKRLKESAHYFGFAFDYQALSLALYQACINLIDENTYRVRLTLQKNGQFTIMATLLMPLKEPVRIKISPYPIEALKLFLNHKTSQRTQYDRAVEDAEQVGMFDMVFWNASGNVTEGARSNVFVRQGRNWHTPPLNAGVLPGIMRSIILDDPAWNAREKNITLNELRIAEEIIVCNALRGIMRAELCDDLFKLSH
jgi:para-aminobenzoate synthetase/4-amino-4-deoxychorismate lyase